MQSAAREVGELIIGKKYNNSIDCEGSPAFSVEPCVGGMVSGIQVKWRVHYVSNREEKVLVVMSGVPFMLTDKYVIQYSEKGKMGELFKGCIIKLSKGYAIYSLL